ncbi:hypothetical protein SERLADRAFT_477663 [Serpula lacrymans var. lacrymans S7.9]|uniref:Polyketide synthase-like phosphopantetheine-binding domain-containing protein n=1 Tax=Serpula lacrymans var. lacrymans (strain S7.9) TaxID=578457 RepID=F8P9D2_SERL9|nr:uncharacterized protein SERLADRAFT_477663 [Serpula lacrymans var. lacrymans S7.9]EGO20261.1 hypothetical protein SERLADRAFT_477663 [Serpula lacrymans var. lacrymans S7.9]
MENIIASNPFVAGTAMFGRERNQVGIIVEPKKGCEVDINDLKQVAEFRNKIWPEVEEANRTAPAFSRIFKEMILVAHSDKPMLRTGKGTVMKKATVKAYEEDINNLYDTVEESTRAGNDVPLPKSWTEEELQGWLMAHAAIVNADREVDPEADFFEQGFDSLTATFLKNRIIGSLKSSPDLDIRAAAGRVNQNIVFNSPSIKLLSKSLANLIANRETNGQNGSLSDEEEIENMIAKYSGGLPEASTPVEHIANGHSGHVVLLTGSTGGLGSYLLASLLEHEAVRHVIAFNRPSKGRVTIEERQKSAFEDRGLDISLLQLPKLQYLEGDAAQERLSLDEVSYNELQTSTTIIIHNAWRLDFNLSLSSFEPNIKGTKNLIDLALSSPHASQVRFLFTSSISSAQGWDQSKGPFPEEVQFNPSVASHGSGYGTSKYVCERLLEKSGLQASSFRIGQVSGGSPRGAWSITDWVPIIVKSSLGIGALPIAKGVVAWLPPHAVSDAIIDVAFSKAKPQIALNLVHPRPVEWASLMKPVGEALVRKNLITAPLPLVPFYEWFAKVEEIAAKASGEELKTIPAVKLLEFMRSLASADKSIRELGSEDAEAAGFTKFSTTKAQQVRLVAADAELWVDYWEAVGMFA